MSAVPTTDLPLNQFRCVRVTSLDGRSDSEYVVHESQVATFIEAQKNLHFEPGVNPHTGGVTQRIGRIQVLSYKAQKPRWWSTPDLMENDDPAGATVFETEIDGEDAWVHPEVLRREEEQYRHELDVEGRC
jgi:hypothetical protein